MENKPKVFYYGDSPSVHSIPDYSPTIIRNKHINEVDILPFEDWWKFFEESGKDYNVYIVKSKDGIETECMDIEDYQVYCPMTMTDDNNINRWSDIKRIFRHEYKGEIARVSTKFGVADVTVNHSLINSEGHSISPNDVIVDETELFSCPVVGQFKGKHGNFANYFVGTEELAMLYGFFAAEGSVSYMGKAPWKTPRIRLAQKDVDVLKKYQGICERNLGIKGYICEEEACSQLVIPGTKMANHFSSILYNVSKEKKVPKEILNAPENIKKAFIAGYIEGDGQSFGNDRYRYGSKSQTLAQGVLWLFRSVYNKDYGVNINDNDPKKFVYTTVSINNSEAENSNGKKVKKVLRRGNYDGFVYDLETEDHRFTTGVGCVQVHNTGFGIVAKHILNGIYDTNKYDIHCLGINFNGDLFDKKK